MMQRSNISRWSRFGLAAIALSLMAGAPAVWADAGDLAGSWAGSGNVVFSSGQKEKARCRASFSKIGASSYSMNATCATSSAKVAQSATLRKTGGNSYSGQFRNPEYNVSGSIRVTVSGNSQNVSMSSDAGSASFSMSRL